MKLSASVVGDAAVIHTAATEAGMGQEHEAICVRFGRNLRRLRWLAGLSQAEVGERLAGNAQCGADQCDQRPRRLA